MNLSRDISDSLKKIYQMKSFFFKKNFLYYIKLKPINNYYLNSEDFQKMFICNYQI